MRPAAPSTLTVIEREVANNIKVSILKRLARKLCYRGRVGIPFLNELGYQLLVTSANSVSTGVLLLDSNCIT